MLPATDKYLLLTNLCKLMEKEVNNRLEDLVESQNLYDLMQFGFRTKRSTSDLLIRLHQQIHGFANSLFTTATSSDFEKVFDRLCINY